MNIKLIGDIVKVTVDRPLGSKIGEESPVEEFAGKVIAIIHRRDDVEEKWVVAPSVLCFTKEEIWEKVFFTEQYYDSEIIM